MSAHYHDLYHELWIVFLLETELEDMLQNANEHSVHMHGIKLI